MDAGPGAGAIVEDLDHVGEIHVLAADVTIRRVRLTSGTPTC